MTPQDALSKAIKNAGGIKAVAEHFGIEIPAVYQWMNRKTPPTRVLALEELTGVSRHDLRPDVFGPKPKKGRAQ